MKLSVTLLHCSSQVLQRCLSAKLGGWLSSTSGLANCAGLGQVLRHCKGYRGIRTPNLLAAGLVTQSG